MEIKKLKQILDKHLKWLQGDEKGIKANLSDSNLRNSDLSYCNLSNCNLSNSDLSNCNLRNSDLSNCNLSDSNLRNSDLSYCNLSDSNLRNSNLSNSDLSNCNLRNSDLSNCKNIFWLKRLLVNKRTVLEYLGFKVYKNYFIAYKSFNENYKIPRKWGKIKSNKIIKEYIDMDIYNDCSRGINIGTEKWCKNCNKQVWELKIDFSADICIPIYTDGKIRVSEAQILKKIIKD